MKVRGAFDHGGRNCTMTTGMCGFTFVGYMASLPLLSKLIFIYSIVLYFVRLLCLCFHFIINVDLWFEILMLFYMLCIQTPNFGFQIRHLGLNLPRLRKSSGSATACSPLLYMLAINYK